MRLKGRHCMKIERSADCGNSPKNTFAENAAITVLTADEETLSKLLVLSQ